MHSSALPYVLTWPTGTIDLGDGAVSVELVGAKPTGDVTVTLTVTDDTMTTQLQIPPHSLELIRAGYTGLEAGNTGSSSSKV